MIGGVRAASRYVWKHRLYAAGVVLAVSVGTGAAIMTRTVPYVDTGPGGLRIGIGKAVAVTAGARHGGGAAGAAATDGTDPVGDIRGGLADGGVDNRSTVNSGSGSGSSGSVGQGGGMADRDGGHGATTTTRAGGTTTTTRPNDGTTSTLGGDPSTTTTTTPPEDTTTTVSSPT